jgi:hypothetical protein
LQVAPVGVLTPAYPLISSDLGIPSFFTNLQVSWCILAWFSHHMSCCPHPLLSSSSGFGGWDGQPAEIAGCFRPRSGFISCMLESSVSSTSRLWIGGNQRWLVPFVLLFPLLSTALPSDSVLFDCLLLGMTRQISTLEEKHSRDQAELVQRCADFEEKYFQSQTELSQVSTALDDANALSSSLHAQLNSEKVRNCALPRWVPITCSVYEGVDFCLQEEKRILAASRDNIDRLYLDSSNSLTILERSHRFTMEELDNQRCRLQESADEVTHLKQLISAKDATIKELRASKKSIAQELETARLAAKVAEETSVTLKAQRDKAMDKAIRAGRILMRRPSVTVPEDIRADVNAAPDSSSRPSSSVAPEKDITK